MVDRILGRGREPEREPTATPETVEADPRTAVWTRVQLARNIRRPRTLELIDAMTDEFIELHGDRLYADDAAIVAGLARIDDLRFAVVGHQKGSDTDENIRRNFGMPNPEGYRKGMRVMEMAERYGLPVLTLVDTPGAFPGPGAEERGVAEAIARSIALMSRLRTPIVTVITGEGGSGGALAIAVGDVVIALENAVYSVISPEGCASILWRTADEAATAALAMRMSAQDQRELGVIDRIVDEPGEGAHTDHAAMGRLLRPVVGEAFAMLRLLPLDDLVEARYRRYRAFGPYEEITRPPQPPAERAGLAGRLRGILDAGRSLGAPAPGTKREPQEPSEPEGV